MFSLLFVLMLSDRQTFRVLSTDDAAWSENATWDQPPLIPEASDRVLIPGRNRQKRSISIKAVTNANAASVMVGASEGAFGSLTIYGALNVDDSARDLDLQAGRMYVGRQQGKGVVLQEPGSTVVLDRSLRIGYDSLGDGEYFVRDAELRVGQDLHVGGDKQTVGFLDLTGLARVQARGLHMGSGNSKIKITSFDDDVPTISVERTGSLQGSLTVDLRSMQNTMQSIPLISMGGNRSGGFRGVRVHTQQGVDYELIYGKSDVVLEKIDRPLTRFEDWREHHFGAERTPGSGAYDDPDADGVPNVGEYRIGCDPHVNEGDAVRPTVNSAGRVSFRYIERTDRTDVRVVPQASTNGRVWSSELLTTRVISTTGNTRVMRATATSSDLVFRLAFELLPDEDVRPNVLFVVVDDLNDWTEGLGGHPQTLTPNFNRIAGRGVRFTQAYTTTALCNPARVAMLTGRLPTSTGIYGNSNPMRLSPVLADAVTIPENFKASGYHISGGGKLFHNRPEVAWDAYFPSLTDHRPDDPLPPNRPLNGIEDPLTRWFDWGPVDVPDNEMGDGQVANWVASRLADSREEPFLLTCGFFRPHLPLFVPPKFFEPFANADLPPGIFPDDLDDLPDVVVQWIEDRSGSDHRAVLANDEWHSGVRAYLACVYFADQQLGRVLDALENSSSLRNTIVVVTSDNGWHLGEKTAWRKGSLWEAACHVPLIVSAPGTTTAGTECHETVSLIDLYPTLNELCNLPTIPTLDGQSLVPQLRDPSTTRTTPAITTRYYNHTVRDKRWRYVRYETGQEELYDHLTDTYERHNLADDPQHRATMDRLAGWIPEDQHPPVNDNDED